MKLENLLNKPLPKMPDEIKAALNKNQITRTTLEGKNEIYQILNYKQKLATQKWRMVHIWYR